jgi:hypothetical protein
MYEFDSVSVSSFEAGSLAATLTERSADGWDVVAVVTAGSDVVAYLKRATKSDSGAEEPAAIDTEAIEVPSTAAELLVADTADATASSASASSPSSDTASSDAGWAASSGSWGDTATSAPATSSTGGTYGIADTGTTGAAETGDRSAWVGSSQQVAATQPAANPQVPAGWYADPAGRYELRYWDGGAWTEHVSRAGQQFTDPPIP